MNSKAVFLFFILIVFVNQGCQKEPEPKPLPDSNYPTIYKPLTQAEWAERNADFQHINTHEGLSLNAYGFVEGEIQLNESDSLTAELIIPTLEDIIQLYQSFLGILNQESLNLKNDLRISIPGYTGGSATIIEHYFQVMEEFKQEDFWPELKSEFDVQRYFLRQKSIEGQKFSGPIIYFTFNGNEHNLKIEKNWFPNAYIPMNEIYTFDEAVGLAYRFILKETGIDTWENIKTFTPSKTLIYQHNRNEIGIHECWKFRLEILEQYYYYIFIDTQTGEIILNYKRGMYYI